METPLQKDSPNPNPNPNPNLTPPLMQRQTVWNIKRSDTNREKSLFISIYISTSWQVRFENQN